MQSLHARRRLPAAGRQEAAEKAYVSLVREKKITGAYGKKGDGAWRTLDDWTGEIVVIKECVFVNQVVIIIIAIFVCRCVEVVAKVNEAYPNRPFWFGGSIFPFPI